MRDIRLLFLMILLVGLASGCNVNESKQQLRPDIEAFFAAEFPEAAFAINREKGLISPVNPAVFSDAGDREITPVFELSDGASLYDGETRLVSGETKIDVSDGLSLTVQAEGGETSAFYLYLDASIPSSYLLEEISYQLNPSGRNPLSAKLNIQTRENADIRARILGDQVVETPTFRIADDGEIPVLGLYAGRTNQIEVILVNNNAIEVRDTVMIETSALPDFMPDISIDKINPDRMEPGMHFSELHIGNAGSFNSYPVIYDNNGEVRWYTDLSEHGKITWPVQFTDRNTFYAIYGVTIFEYDMMGNELNRIVVEGNNMHHEVIEIPNGNYIVAVSRVGTEIEVDGQTLSSVEDFIIEVDPMSGQVVDEWDMGEILDVDRYDVVNGGADWFHMNAVWYDEQDDALIISGRNQGVVKVNRQNELQWILAPHQGWGQAGRSGTGDETIPYLLTAVDGMGTPYSADIQNGTVSDPAFEWVWGQHTPMLLPNGNILVFDNGTNRNFGNAAANYSRAVEYKINEEDMTVEQVWTFGKDLGGGAFSNIISDVDRLSITGNRLYAPGYINDVSESRAKTFELSYPDNDIVFESTFSFKNELSAGQGWGNIDIVYRAERVSFY